MRVSWVAIAAAAGCLAGPACADTLRDALVRVYATNPTLTGQRATQRATDETVPIARAQGRPQLSGTTSYSEFVLSNSGIPSADRSLGVGAQLSAPFFSGGAVRNSVRAAEARVLQGRANLRNVEANVFTQAVSAYLDVIRDEAIVELNRGNVRVLQTNLQASRDRFEVGDLTRTDVAQSEARLAVAQSQLQSAEAQLNSSRENYLRLIGAPPVALEAPPPLPPLPATPEDAVAVAMANNPSLEAARQATRAADYDIDVARAARSPRLSGVARGDYSNNLGSAPSAFIANSNRSATVGVQATLPIYQGGGPGARVRQAQAVKSQTLEQITSIERDVVADARATYSLYQASQAVIASSEAAIAANELALEGVRAENSVGTRDVLDVLNAEQELLNSRVQLVTARRDAYVAGFALLAAIGRAEAKDLNLDGGPLYDPVANYRRVRNKASDWSDDPAPQPVATSTVGLPSPSTPIDTGSRVPVAPPPQPGPLNTQRPLGSAAPSAAPAATPGVTSGVR